MVVRRYVTPCAAVVIVAIVVAVLASGRHPTRYQASCLTRFSVPLTAATGTNYFDVQETVALGELARAQRGPLFVNASRGSGVTPTSLAARTQIVPGPLDTYFGVSVTDGRPVRAAVLATALCAELATQLSDQRDAERAVNALQIRDQLVALENRRVSLAAAITPGAPPTPEIQALDAAIVENRAQYGRTLALPRDFVTSTQAVGSSRVAASALRRNLQVAAGAVPLTWFLLIMIGESTRRSARDAPPR